MLHGICIISYILTTNSLSYENSEQQVTQY